MFRLIDRFCSFALAGRLMAAAATVSAVGASGGADGLLADPRLPDEIIFSARGASTDGHWYANVGWQCNRPERKYYPSGGQLYRMNLRTGRVTLLIDDPQVGYEADRILFSWRKAGTEFFHLYEVNTDGSGARQLTDGPYDDIEPAYLPDGGIIFCSSRCKCWVPCGYYPVLTLHRCDGNGKNIRKLSSNAIVENTPWPLPDGRVLYTRWEYVDRNQVRYQHLWTISPDGTDSMVVYGNQFPGGVYIDAKPVPGSSRIVYVDSPGHGQKDHTGYLTIVDPKSGTECRKSAWRLELGTGFTGSVMSCREPYPVAEDCILFASGRSIYVTDGRGKTRVLYSLSEQVSSNMIIQAPRPLCRRVREPVVPAKVDLAVDTGRLILADVYRGRRMAGVKRGEIKSLLVLEQLQKPVNYFFGQVPISAGGTFTLKRVLGTVPVEADGSAYLTVPAMRSLFFVALDDAGMSVKRMQSFVTIQPGEVTGCVGCHESRVEAPGVGPVPLAVRRLPSRIESVSDLPDIFDYPRDIQPILDRHCVSCHNPGKYSGRVNFIGDYTEFFSLSYVTLIMKGLVSDAANGEGNREPRAIGSSASPLMRKLDGSHRGVKVSPREYRTVQLWIDAGANYAGTYAALGHGDVYGRVSRKVVDEVVSNRCTVCHAADFGYRWQGPGRLFDVVKPGGDIAAFNLSRPEKSMILLAPLSKAAGGLGLCGRTNSTGVVEEPAGFAGVEDPGYRKLLAVIREAAGRLDQDPGRRHDRAGFRPRPEYYRELKRFGVLPDAFDPATENLDWFATDRAYWQSLWHQPQK